VLVAIGRGSVPASFVAGRPNPVQSGSAAALARKYMPREIKERQQPTVALSRFDTMRFEAYLAGEPGTWLS